MESIFKKIYLLLDNKRLKEALGLLSEQSSEIKEWKIKSEIDDLAVSHNLLLYYTKKGSEDKNRKSIYDQLLRKAYEYADLLSIYNNLQKSKSGYYKIFKLQFENPIISFKDLRISLELYSNIIGTLNLYSENEKRERENAFSLHEMTIFNLFNKIVYSFLWSDKDENDVISILKSNIIKDYDISILVSALTISLLHLFDVKKFNALIEAYKNSNAEISQRALVGIVIIAYIFEKRIKLYPQILARLSLLNDDPTFIKDICHLQFFLLYALETNNISQKLHEKIILEIENELIENNTYSSMFETKKNELFKKNKNKYNTFDEIDMLQRAGADICMETFSNLKNFEFFNNEAHWFYPYFKKQKEITEFLKENRNNAYITVLLESEFVCNSDKYSFCLTLSKLSQSQKEHLTGSINEMPIDDKRILDSLKHNKNTTMSRESICKLYIHDIYRYFKLWKYKDDIVDVFNYKFKLWECTMFKKAITESDTLDKISSFYLKFEHYNDALEILEIITDKSPINSKAWAKKGYALQNLAEYELAIKCFINSDVLSPNNNRVNSHIAQCYYNEEKYQSAIIYYKKIEANSPEDFNTLVQIGYCYIKIHKFEEALKYLFKVEYLNKKNLKAKRAIAWCYFLLKRYDDSCKYYKLITRCTKANAFDYMNYGHVLFAMKEMTKAIKYYRKSQSATSREEFINLYKADRNHLLDANIKPEEIDIMLDIIL